MIEYYIYEALLSQRNLKNSDVSKATGISNATLSDWKMGRTKPKLDKIEKIANFFEVPTDYLVYGDQTVQHNVLTNQDELDIIDDVDKIMRKLEQGDSIIMKYNDKDLNKRDKQLLRESLLSVCRQSKIINKKREKQEE